MSSRTRRGGLGRGLGALIPTAAPAESPAPVDVYFGDSTVDAAEHPADPAEPALGADSAGSVDGPLPVPGVSFAEVPIADVHPNAKQPRQVFDEDALAELTHSVREFGVLQPIVVRPDAGGYELVMGERRLRAAAAAGLTTVPAIVRSTADDAMLRDALLENIHRAQLNPLEEAAAYQQLLEEFGTTHEELAQRIGRSRPQVTNTIRLLNLPVPVQRRVAAGVLSAGHARALLGLDDRELQDELASRIVAEGLSVRATEELVALAASGHGEKKVARRASAQRISAPGITDLADKLSDALDTRVRVELGRRKGRITVEFASVDDLERIVGMMAPQLATQRAEGSQPNEP
ncbi:MAG: putative parB-like partition protein [Pseudonocardiales bacterium]|nr:putative parB-like partition protein [Pseudonocardiales bacterium]